MTATAGGQLVVLDVGGVLVETARHWREAMVLASIDSPLDPQSARFAYVRSALSDPHQAGWMSTVEYCAALARASGGQLSPGDVSRIVDAWIIGPYPWTVRLLEALRSSRTPVALLTNTISVHWNRILDPTFDVTGSLRRIPLKFPSHETGLTKPMRAAFESVEQATNFRGPEIIFFDDSAANVAAARHVGWRSNLVVIEKGLTPPEIVLHRLVSMGVAADPVANRARIREARW